MRPLGARSSRSSGRASRVGLVFFTLCWLLGTAITTLVVLTQDPGGPPPTEVSEAEIASRQAWRKFCASLGHYTRVYAKLRDQGVKEDREFPHSPTFDDPRVLEVMEATRELVYDSPDLPPVVLAAEVEVSCLETKENNQ